MNDEKKQLFALMAHAEEQQKTLDKAIETITQQQQQIADLHTALPSLASRLFKESLNDARTSIDGDLSNHANNTAKELSKVSERAIRATNHMNERSEQLDLRYIMSQIAIFIVCAVIIMFSLIVLVPSFDQIADRRTVVKSLTAKADSLTAKANSLKLDIRPCGTGGTDTCVRVMTKQCGLGQQKDYCVADLKR